MRYAIRLPLPPSVNRYWRTFRGRVLVSADGREYRRVVGMHVAASERGPMFSAPVYVAIVLNPPDKRRRDLDNVLKALLDSLTAAGVWGDDSQVDGLRITRGDRKEGGSVYVAITDDVREW